MPSRPPPFFAFEHALHAPVHAASQQKPSAQKPLAHSAPLAHVTPAGSWHAPVTHVAGAEQSLSSAHMLLHVPSAAHVYGLHDFTTEPTHALWPSQAPCVVWTPFVHSEAGPHATPAFTGPQTPSAPPPLPAVVQDSHSPLHATLQQTPAAQ